MYSETNYFIKLTFMIYYEAVNGVGDDGIVKSMEGTEA